MANQTIDGVPRELLERLAVPMLRTPEYLIDHRDALDELRALLDAPAKSDYLQSCEAAHNALEPDSQPQGDTVNTDVRTILLYITPGAEGMGQEVYARSCEDVVNALGKQGDRIEEMEMELHRLKAIKPQGEPVAVKVDYSSLDAEQRLAFCRGDPVK